MKTSWVTQSSMAFALIVAATACANLIGLSEYEVDESSTGSPGGAGGRGGTGGTAAGRGGAGGGTGGSSAGTGGSSACIPTGDAEECGANDECCDFESDRASCVDFPDRGTFCASRCASGSECRSGCCVQLDSGDSACAFPEFCEGTGGTGGTNGASGSGGGIGSPCATRDAACGSGTSTGHCNGRWCTKPCTTSIECPGDTWCIPNNAGNDTCFVGCLTTADCADLAGTTCQSAEDVSGLPISVCAVPPTSASER
jgi:hypothetical protein